MNHFSSHGSFLSFLHARFFMIGQLSRPVRYSLVAVCMLGSLRICSAQQEPLQPASQGPKAVLGEPIGIPLPTTTTLDLLRQREPVSPPKHKLRTTSAPSPPDASAGEAENLTPNDPPLPQGISAEDAIPTLDLFVPPPVIRSVPPPQAPPTETLEDAPPSLQRETQGRPAELPPPPTGVRRNESWDALDAIPPELLSPVPSGGKPPTDSLPAAPSPAAPSPAEPPSEMLPGMLPPPASPTPRNRFQEADAANGAGPADKPQGPYFYASTAPTRAIQTDAAVQGVPYSPGEFLPTPFRPTAVDPYLEGSPYRGKSAVPVQRPWVELWRPLYTGGIYPPAKDWFGEYNLVMPHFMVYGDFRTAVAVNRNAQGDANSWASRLNLDMDLEITATERIHAFMGPLDRNGDFTRLDFTNSAEFVDRTDIRLDNLFFEGDAGAIWGGLTDQNSPFDLPFSFGFLPLFYQNGIWAADNVIGAAVALPSKNSPLLKWSNYDATFFWASDQVNSDAFPGDNNAAEFIGTAWFIEAYDGYIEADYAFVHDDAGLHRSYHNLSVAYTRRYFQRISNSVRFITNFDQSLPSGQRTADGHMILLENSLISAAPNTFVPYCNFFYGQGRTQSLARAGVAGGILNNTGINFETDALTGYPTLDATGVNTSGAAIGVNMLGANFDHQLILELAALAANGDRQFRNAPGDQYAFGMRYQKPLNNAWIFRTDHMYGWLRGAEDIRGSRIELRWKF